MRILVTGAAGFVGSNLAKRLAADGHETIALDDFSSASWVNLVDFPGDVLTCDVSSSVDLLTSGKPFDVIFHEGSITDTTVLDILPRKVVLTLATNPAGLQLKLDGQPVATPLSFDAVVGITRTIEAVTPQSSGNTTYTFASWSDGGASSHDISTPSTNTTYTAIYQGGVSNSIALDAVLADD